MQPKRRRFLNLAPLGQIPQDLTGEIQKNISEIHTALSSLSKKISMAQFLLNNSHACQMCTAINTFMTVAASCKETQQLSFKLVSARYNGISELMLAQSSMTAWCND